MMPIFNDSQLHNILNAFGYRHSVIEWAVAILHERIDISSLRNVCPLAEARIETKNVASLTDDQIEEAAMHAAMDKISREMRAKHFLKPNNEV
jgi:hypothetical protein